jgi:DNA adenine methylase
MAVKSPINWYGGKYYMASKISELMPKHKTYVEVFGGAGHLLFKKSPSDIEVYNDIDKGLYDFFNLIRQPEKAEKLKIQLELSPHSREEFYTSRDTWKDEEDEIERVRKWYVHVMQSFSGHCDSWTHSKNVSRRGMSQATSKYLGNIEKNLPDAVERLRTVQIENMDCIDLIHKYDTPDTLFYLDPPYVHSTRKESARFAYNYEMIDSQHNKLVDTLLNVKGNAILSGYDNEIYDKLLEEGWFRISLGEFKERSTKTIETTKQKREEILWVNFKVN